MCCLPTLIALTCLVASPAPPAQRPDEGVKLYQAVVRTADAVKQLEFTQMLRLIIKQGARMSIGEGWFKPAETRYGWNWLASRCGSAESGRISPKEFAGSDELFRRLDRNRDGVLTADDFDWSDTTPFSKQMSLAQQWLGMVDADGDRKLSKAEWDALFQKVAQGKEYLNAEDVRALLNPPPPPRSAGSFSGMPTKATLLAGLFSGEIGSPCEGPHLGAAAPDFTLKSPDGLKSVTLSKLVGPKPIVLIFGSFT